MIPMTIEIFRLIANASPTPSAWTFAAGSSSMSIVRTLDDRTNPIAPPETTARIDLITRERSSTRWSTSDIVRSASGADPVEPGAPDEGTGRRFGAATSPRASASAMRNGQPDDQRVCSPVESLAGGALGVWSTFGSGGATGALGAGGTTGAFRAGAADTRGRAATPPAAAGPVSIRVSPSTSEGP